MLNYPLVEGAYNITFSLVDKGLLEVAGPTGLGRSSFLLGRTLTKTQTGRVYDYGFSIVLGLYVFARLLGRESGDNATSFFSSADVATLSEITRAPIATTLFVADASTD